ncbi:NAD(P)-dependent dehydrogenase, short-chain alcohol dehydrogenase family [Sphingobium faniae]|nr:NAD(P)-dependent dehydrogenase, short-chain alcohol dehydrogenase family [Sphingobium faniae]
MNGQLQDKSIIVTGAGKGIGRSAALTFAKEGASVALAGRTRSSLEETAELIRGGGGKCVVITADVAQDEDCARLISETVAAFGGLYGAFNNAAIDGERKRLADYTPAEFEDIIATNLRGTWNCMRHEILWMQDHGGGVILNVSSATTQPAEAYMGLYVSSKYGIHGLTTTAALEYAEAGIRVNVLVPGAIGTPMMDEVLDSQPGMREAVVGRIPLKRLGLAQEMADAAVWLLSERNGYMTGSSVTIDGGYVLV